MPELTRPELCPIVARGCGLRPACSQSASASSPEIDNLFRGDRMKRVEGMRHRIAATDPAIFIDRFRMETADNNLFGSGRAENLNRAAGHGRNSVCGPVEQHDLRRQADACEVDRPERLDRENLEFVYQRRRLARSILGSESECAKSVRANVDVDGDKPAVHNEPNPAIGVLEPPGFDLGVSRIDEARTETIRRQESCPGPR